MLNILHLYKVSFDSSKENLNILDVISKENTQMIEAKPIIKLIEQEEKWLLVIRQKKMIITPIN